MGSSSRFGKENLRMDRFSNLPDEIICHIVSFLSAKEAAFVSVLSKRWQNLYTIIPNLNFDVPYQSQDSLMSFVDGVIALPPSSRVRHFCLSGYVRDDLTHYAHINRCLCNVLKRGVLDLELKVSVDKEYSLPLEVFTCQTIVKLELGRGFVIDFVPENAFLPALKTLYLYSVQFYDYCGCSFQKLLSACPVLEELDIDYVDLEQWKWSHTVSSPSLRRLTIRRGEYEFFDGSDFSSITFDTPSLVFLKYDDFVPHEYPTVNLDSLVEANLELLLAVDHAWQVGYVDEDDPITSDPSNLIQGLRNVQILKLLSTETTEIFYLFRDAIPVFESLHYLSLNTDLDEEEKCWSFFPFLLKKTPNLKTLVIDGYLHCDGNDEPDYVCECLSGYSCLWSCTVEVLEIKAYRGDMDELVQLKHFLRNLSCLKLVKIHARARTDKEKWQITTELLMIPRASVNCKIQVTFP